MAPPQAPPLTDLIALAIRLVNANQPARARIVCEQALATFAPHPAVHQLLAVLDLQDGRLASAREHAARSLALRPDHVPTLLAMGDIALAQHDARAASRSYERAVALAPDQPEAWFKAALARQDLHDLPGAIAALVNYGIVLQESGRLDDALRAYGRAFRLREQAFGRIAHALATPGTGRLWLHLDDLRAELRAQPA